MFGSSANPTSKINTIINNKSELSPVPQQLINCILSRWNNQCQPIINYPPHKKTFIEILYSEQLTRTGMEDIDMVKNSFQKVDTLAKYRRIYCQGQGNRGRGRNQENLQEEVDKENCDWKNVGEKEFVENVSNVGEIKGKEWSDRSRAKELSQENYINQQASSLMLRLDTANKSQRQSNSKHAGQLSQSPQNHYPNSAQQPNQVVQHRASQQKLWTNSPQTHKTHKHQQLLQLNQPDSFRLNSRRRANSFRNSQQLNNSIAQLLQKQQQTNLKNQQQRLKIFYDENINQVLQHQTTRISPTKQLIQGQLLPNTMNTNGQISSNREPIVSYNNNKMKKGKLSSVAEQDNEITQLVEDIIWKRGYKRNNQNKKRKSRKYINNRIKLGINYDKNGSTNVQGGRHQQLKCIMERVRLSEITFKDSKYRNLKHQVDHLNSVYALQCSIRRQLADKIVYEHAIYQ